MKPGSGWEVGSDLGTEKTECSSCSPIQWVVSFEGISRLILSRTLLVASDRLSGEKMVVLRAVKQAGHLPFHPRWFPLPNV